MLYLQRIICLFTLSLIGAQILAQTDPDRPNILLIIADDVGVDISNGYQANIRMPTTLTLDSLRQAGLTFKNAWAYPVCSPTRAAIMSGKYGVKTGVTDVPGNLNVSDTSIFRQLALRTDSAYATAVIGKWHISMPVDYNHPANHGVDYYEGEFSGAVDDYFDWTRVLNGVATQETTYATSYFTDAAINWVNDQEQPWFLWLAEVAAHTPFHVPPADLYSINNVNTNRQQYIAAIEAMDTEIGRLLHNIPDSVLQNTMILYIGDNGTPGSVIQNFPTDHAKGALYQGGVHVPFFVSGPLVSRAGEEESAMVHAVDIHASILEMAGVDMLGDLQGGIYNSLSFVPQLSSQVFTSRRFNYTERGDDWTIRNDAYKLINFTDGTQEFYDLINDSLEATDLIGMLTTHQATIKADMEAEAAVFRTGWSCRDSIKNGDETAMDCGGSCQPCAGLSIEKGMDDQANIRSWFEAETNTLSLVSEDDLILGVELYGLDGRLIQATNGYPTLQFSMQVKSDVPPVFLLRIQLADRIVYRKLGW